MVTQTKLAGYLKGRNKMLKTERKEYMNRRMIKAIEEIGDPDVYRTGPPWGNYDPIYNCILALVLQWEPHESVLDLGCNLGDFTCRLRKVGFKKIVGVEVSSVAVEYARKRHSEIEFLASDILDLTFEEDFDWVIASGVLNFRHFSKEEYTLLVPKIHSFLRAGGYLVEQNPLNAFRDVAYGKTVSLEILSEYFDLIISLQYSIKKKYAYPGRRAHTKVRRINLFQKKAI